MVMLFKKFDVSSSAIFFHIIIESNFWMMIITGKIERDEAERFILTRVRFDRIFSFRYSRRPRTAALSYPDHLPEATKEDRLNRVIAVQNCISLEKNQTLLGKILEVLVEKAGSKKDPTLLTARTRTNHIVHFADPRAEVGSRVKVRIRQASTFHLKAETIEAPWREAAGDLQR